MPSSQTTPRQKEPVVPVGSGRPRVSPEVVLQNPLPQGVQEALGDTKNPTSEGETDTPSRWEGDLEELQQQERVQRVQERFNQKNPTGTFLAKVQQAKEAEWKWWEAQGQLAQARKQSRRGHQAQARSLEDKYHPHVEASVPPVPKSPWHHITTDWGKWHSEKSAGTRRSLNSSFANCPSRDLLRRLTST